jgi:hypothetical protein
MATTFTDTLFATEYKDDFSDSAGFYRILYNGGKVLQSRELTQMQTIINKQIERFGNNIFKEGAVVKAGGFSLDTAYEFVKLDPTSTSTAANVGDIITGATSGIKAEILEIAVAASGDPVTYYVRYVNTSSVNGGTTTPRFTPGESLASGRIVQITNSAINPAVGRGSRVTVGESVYFTQGFFVYTESQAYIISKYSDAPNGDIGFKIVQDVISENDDVTLYDNSTSNPNLTAPGAHRYRIQLYLTDRASLSASENFIHVATVKNGAIFAAVESGSSQQYNIPRDVIATRIKENSGDYEIKPYRIAIESDSQDTHVLLKVSDGIVVVDGYRSARFLPSDFRIKKPTTTTENTGEFTAVNYGNYVDVLADSAVGGPNISTFESLDLMNVKDFNGGASAKIGEARVRAVHENGANLRYHMFDINMNAGQSFRDAKSIGTDSNNWFNPIQIGFNTILEDTRNNSLLYQLPYTRPQTIDPQSVEVQIMRKGTSTGGGDFTLTIPTGYVLDNANDWLILTDAANGGLISHSGLTGLTTGSNTTTIGGLPTSAPITIYAYASLSSPTIRSKTLQQNVTVTAAVQTDPVTLEKFIDLGQPDIYDVKRITLIDSDGTDVQHKFSLDDGQRDAYYGFGRLVLENGQTAPAGNIYVKFDHFNHTSGNFFAVNSYTGQVDYNKIPSHTLTNGNIVNLRDVLDFRPVKTTSSTFTEADISYLPQPTDLVLNDNTYYLGQAYKLTIDKDANININIGEPGFTPQVPAKPQNTMGLYNFSLGANTLNSSDVTIKKIDHRRYTMQDIAYLDKRVDKLEEVASFSMLELQTSNFEVLDSAGLTRTKSGFFVDNFTTHILSSTTANDYRASIDPVKGKLRPVYTDDNIRLLFDSDNSTNIRRKGDNIYLDFTEVSAISQPFATKSTVINPFTTSVYTGNMTLSPASDEWRDKNIQSKNIFDNGTQLDTTRALFWDEWTWGWGGKEIEDLQVGDATNTISKSTTSSVTNTVNKVISESTLLEVIDERVLNVSLLPFIRSRIVSIKARGLRPNSNVFLFMDNKPMADYVREEPFEHYSKKTKDFGNTLRGKKQHKDGSGALTTNASGAVDISFQVPNNSTYRFRAGVLPIKITDVSTGDETVSGTLAYATYTAQGYLDTVHQDINSTRILEVEGLRSVTRKQSHYAQGAGGGDGSGPSPSSSGPNWYNADQWKSVGLSQPSRQNRSTTETFQTAYNLSNPNWNGTAFHNPVGPSRSVISSEDDQAQAGADAGKSSGGCCFIMLEARYGDGTMDDVVRRYRDEYMTDRNRRGYYKLAEVLVPLMRKSKVFKWIVTKTFADPLVSYGKYYYGKNKHGIIFAPVKNLWMKVFDTIGGDTEFIRENGEIV